MAYFETLGQLQSNDYTFRKIYSFAGNPSNVIIGDATALDIHIDDYILMVGTGCAENINGDPNPLSSKIAISGCNTIFSDSFNSYSVTVQASSWWGYAMGNMYIFIGKATQTSLTITGTYPATGFTTSIYKLCPRD